MYTYNQRLAQGLRQFMAGARKFATKYITRNDIASLTPEATRISGIEYVMDIDKKEAEAMLNLTANGATKVKAVAAGGKNGKSKK